MDTTGQLFGAEAGAGLNEEITLPDLVHDAIFACDMNNRITFWNRSAEETYGWSRSEIIGQPYDTIQHRSPHLESREINLDLADYIDDKWEGEVRHQHQNGSLLILQSRQVVQRDDTGAPHSIVSFNRDITHYRALEIQLQAHTSELERSNEELESFARIASHDLREPLRMISSYAKLIDRRYRDRLDESGGEFLDYVIDGAERMSSLIRDLLHVARVGSEPARMQSLDLNEVLGEARQDLSVMIDEFQVELINDPLPTVDGDRSQLRRVFQNLIENAIKFRGQRTPHIEIAAERLHDIWRISISDNGPGIERADVTRIFIPYGRGRTSGPISGSGTGLAVARKIIQGHGGRIWVESTPGSGSTFHFTFPVGEKENV